MGSSYLDASELKKPPVENDKTPKQHIFMSMNFQMPDVGQNLEDASAFVHYKVSGIETACLMFGAVPGTLHPDEGQCKVLRLMAPHEKDGYKRWFQHN